MRPRRRRRPWKLPAAVRRPQPLDSTFPSRPARGGGRRPGSGRRRGAAAGSGGRAQAGCPVAAAEREGLALRAFRARSAAGPWDHRGASGHAWAARRGRSCAAGAEPSSRGAARRAGLRPDLTSVVVGAAAGGPGGGRGGGCLGWGPGSAGAGGAWVGDAGAAELLGLSGSRVLGRKVGVKPCGEALG